MAHRATGGLSFAAAQAAAAIELRRRKRAGDLIRSARPKLTWDIAEKYHDDPVGFFRDVLGIRSWRKQRAIALALREHRKIAVRSGQKVGKTIIAAAIAWWWVCTRARGRCILTSRVFTQIKRQLWKEVRELHRTAPYDLGATPALSPLTGVVWDDGRVILGLTAVTPEAMQGYSGDELLYIADEGSGIEDNIFEAIEGNLQGGGSLLMLGNPTRTSGYFFEAFHRAREFWYTIHISAVETPNASGDEAPIPGLASKEVIDAKIQELGEDHPWVQVRIFGNFPKQGSNCVVPLALVTEAIERYDEVEGEGRLVLGVDVARYGDDESAIAPRRGLKIFPLEVVAKQDSKQVAAKVLSTIVGQPPERKALRIGDEHVWVHIDAGGGYGSGVADELRSLKLPWLHVVEFNSSSAANDPEQFFNLRSEMHFAIVDWLKQGGALPEDAKLEAELVAPTYDLDPRARRRVEPKDKIKQRLPGGRSPDRSDAVALAIRTPSSGILVPSLPADDYRFGDSRGY